jgi:tripartite-type tricarboxylate transporter receptor subunit TctC
MQILVRSISSATVFAALACAVSFASAQQRPADYPKKSIRLLAPVAPGGGLDMVTRAAAQFMTEKLGQSVIVDNRPGGGTVIAMDIVAQAAPDGYTIFSGTDTFMIVGAMKRVAYDVRKAYEPIVRMTAQPAVMVVSPSLPASSVKELIAYAKAKPDALSFGSAGVGTNGHLGLERFKTMAGVRIVHVPYKGSAPAMLDIIAGQIQMVFASTIAATPYIKNGKLKALAVTGLKRVASLPDLPTVSEAGVPGFKMTNSFNMLAPAGTPAHIVLAVNKVVGAGMHTPEMLKRLAADGSEAAELHTPAQFKAEIAKEYAEVEKQVRQLNLKPY